MLYHQSVCVLRVEQEGLQVFRFFAEIIHQHTLVKHHLDEVVFLMAVVVLVAFP